MLGRLRQALDSAAPARTASGEAIALQVSLGTADYASSEQLSMAIERADRAMSVEKGVRKNQARRETAALGLTPASLPSVR